MPLETTKQKKVVIVTKAKTSKPGHYLAVVSGQPLSHSFVQLTRPLIPLHLASLPHAKHRH